MMTCLSPEITFLIEGQEYTAQVIVAVIEEGKGYRDKRFNNIVMIAKPLTLFTIFIPPLNKSRKFPHIKKHLDKNTT